MEAVRVKYVATTGKRSALSLQVVQTLLGLAINNARTPARPADCKGKNGESYQGLTGLGNSTHTKATGAEAGKQMKTPVTGPVWCNLTIQGIFVTAW
jgi:hypothetical protein